MEINNISVTDFYAKSFCLCTDLRNNEDNYVYASSRKILNTQSGILLELTKSGVTSEDHTVYTFVVSDGLLNIQNNNLQSVQY